MISKKVRPSDVMGENYHIYNLSANTYTPSYSPYYTYLFITVTVEDVYGRAVENKTVSLYLDGTLITPNKTTNQMGYAYWELDNTLTSGLHLLKCGTGSLMIFVDNKAEKDHTHSQYLTISDISGKIDTAGTGLSKTGTTLNHTNSVTALNTISFKKIKYDSQGHITGTSDVSGSDLPSHQHTVSQITDFPNLTSKEDVSNKTTAITSSSTNTQYPSAKAVYDLVGEIITIINGTGE